jgi:anthranilate synthase component II
VVAAWAKKKHLTYRIRYDIKKQSYALGASHPDSGRVAFLLRGLAMRLVMIDNYDSFTYNLVQLFYEFELEVVVRRHDEVDLDGIEALKPDWLCISPGPKAPVDAGISKAVIARFCREVPILGVCLGMQAINEIFGGRTVLAPVPVHGKRHEIFHTGKAVFAGLPSPFGAARYHSLMVSPGDAGLEVTARSADGVIMGLSHREYPLHGVQFHPESFLTDYGRELAANFLGLAPGFEKQGKEKREKGKETDIVAGHEIANMKTRKGMREIGRELCGAASLT